jgi:hypothetical protein
MTILESQTHPGHSLLNPELRAEVNKALTDAKRLRRHILRLLAAARVLSAFPGN